jgi:hypothetical protein
MNARSNPTLRGGGRLRALRAAILALAAPALAGGCDLDRLLRTDDPFTVTTPVARDTTNLVNTYAGAIGQFALAMGGLTNRAGGLVTHVGVFTDELYSADGFKDNIDERDLPELPTPDEELTESFDRLQRARAEALNAASLFGATSRAGDPMRAELYDVAAYSILGLAENFCSGIPLGLITDAGFQYGEPRSTGELYEQALVYFDSATSIAAAGGQAANLAELGSARVLLDLGRFDEAAALAADIPDDFAYYVAYNPASNRTQNAIFVLGTQERRFGASRAEGTGHLGLPFDDPRTPRSETPVNPYSGATTFQVFAQLKYDDYDADVPLATAYEARMIEAEAALRAGDGDHFLALLNRARALQGQPAVLDLPASPEARVDLLFRERAYGLWLTAHRLSDLRRLMRQYGRTEEEVFPTGETTFGINYGHDVVFPAPFAELNNPKFKGCMSFEP